MNLNRELEKWNELTSQTSAAVKITSVGEDIYRIEGAEAIAGSTGVKTFGILALVHGNEILGLPVVNEILESILAGTIGLPGTLYVALGNLPAAHANKRFIEEDLNRCFGLKTTKSWEARRARELETVMLNHCDYLLDLHQTVTASRSPFFIFQFAKASCLATVQQWSSDIPIILQFDQIGENTGLSSDEYLRSRGAFGSALELGEKGTADHYDFGVQTCRRFLAGVPADSLNFNSRANPVLHYRGAIKANQPSSLDSNLKNLSRIEVGEIIGRTEGGAEIISDCAGWILFPRGSAVKAGENLFHLCTEMNLQKILGPTQGPMLANSFHSACETSESYV